MVAAVNEKRLVKKLAGAGARSEGEGKSEREEKGLQQQL
jgi:hypothetical protein